MSKICVKNGESHILLPNFLRRVSQRFYKIIDLKSYYQKIYGVYTKEHRKSSIFYKMTPKYSKYVLKW